MHGACEQCQPNVKLYNKERVNGHTFPPYLGHRHVVKCRTKEQTLPIYARWRHARMCKHFLSSQILDTRRSTLHVDVRNAAVNSGMFRAIICTREVDICKYWLDACAVGWQSVQFFLKASLRMHPGIRFKTIATSWVCWTTVIAEFNNVFLVLFVRWRNLVAHKLTSGG